MLSFYAKMYIFLLIDVVFFNFCTPIVLIDVLIVSYVDGKDFLFFRQFQAGCSTAFIAQYIRY